MGCYPILENFDSFNGRDKFDGFHNVQIVVVPDRQVVCRQQDTRVIQQQLAVLQELVKRYAWLRPLLSVI